MIRRQLLRGLPAFSHYFAIQPWDIERLTFAELREYQKQLKTLKPPPATKSRRPRRG